MSAYMCENATFELLGAFLACSTSRRFDPGNSRSHIPYRLHGCTAQPTQDDYRDMSEENQDDEAALAFARVLARENIRSLDHRYPSDDLMKEQLPTLNVSRAMRAVEALFLKRQASLTPGEIARTLDNWNYQACECDDFRHSAAYELENIIRVELMQFLPGFNRDQWGPPPSLTARETA